MRAEPAAVRFDRYVSPEPNTGCWLWTGGLNDKGYASFHVGGRHRSAKGHTYAYEREHGPVPDGLELDHLCRVKSCVNPDHLEAVTHQENFRRGAHLNAIAHRLVVCRNGHADWRPRTDGRGQFCGTCRRQYDARKYASRRGRQ